MLDIEKQMKVLEDNNTLILSKDDCLTIINLLLRFQDFTYDNLKELYEKENYIDILTQIIDAGDI